MPEEARYKRLDLERSTGLSGAITPDTSKSP